MKGRDCARSKSGAFQIYSLPAMDLKFSHSDLAESPRTLESGVAPATEPEAGLERPTVVEMRLESFGAPGGRDSDNGSAGSSGFPPAERPHLMAILSDGSLLLYKAGCRQVPSPLRPVLLLRR